MRRIALLTLLLMLSGCAAATEQSGQTTAQVTTAPSSQESTTEPEAQVEEPETPAEPETEPEADGEDSAGEPEPEETREEAPAQEASEESEAAEESPSPEPSPTETTAAQTYTLADVALRSSAEECWVAIDGAVYDLTAYARSHPGGRAVILGLCGTDGTAEFLGQHGGQARPSMTLDEYYLAPLG